MARKIHRSLDYEKRELRKLQHRVPVLSNWLYSLDTAFDREWTENHCWTYTCGLNFRDLTKEEFTKVKKVLSLPDLKKSITENGVTFSCDVVVNTEVRWGREYKDSLHIDFKWDLPDTCTIEYQDVFVDVEAKDVKITDGQVQLRKQKAIVNCGEKEMMKAVFNRKGGADA